MLTIQFWFVYFGHNKLQEDGQLYKSPFLERIR
jgi:hypothetical protein